MKQDYKQTFQLSFSLRNTYFVNSFIYSIKQIPLIGRLIPETIYGVDGLKVLVNILVGMKEIFTTFFNKILYVVLMVIIPLSFLSGRANGDSYIHILFFLTIAGVIANTGVFNPTKDKYYGVILMRMNAKEYAIVDYLSRTIKIIVGMLVSTLILGFVFHVPIWICLIIPFFIPAAKSLYIAYSLRQFVKKDICLNENHTGLLGWIIMLVSTAVAYTPMYMERSIPSLYVAIIMLVVIVGSIPCIRYIVTFAHYREMYQQLLQERKSGIDPKVTTKNIQQQTIRKRISTDTSITSNRHGFEYFNDLFIKRHKKVLWMPSLIVTIGAAVVWLAAMIAIFYIPELKEKMNTVALTMLPYFVFIMYLINRGTSFTTVLFMNCDHCMLTYNFYKSPQFILKLFTIRLREIIKINLLPAAVIAAGMTALLYLSGGTDQMFNYVIIPVTILALSIFFSVHYLVLYYLLQPYNFETDIKSKTYQLIVSATYIVTFTVMKMELDTFVFGICAIVFCVAYCIIACILIYRLAPKTFRIRS